MTKKGALPMIEGMHHGGIYCADIEESLSFYEAIGFRVLFRTNAMEGDKPLKMAWVKAGSDAVLELIEQEDRSVIAAAGRTPNHIALRIADMDEFVALLDRKGIPVEAGPFETTLEFDRPLEGADRNTFSLCGDRGLVLKILFFRGKNGERFEVVQDNLGTL